MPENQRLFIAVFPPPSLSQALYQIAQQQHAQLGGRCMPAANLHLTLTFLGQTPMAAIPTILGLLAQSPALDCTLSLDTLGSFMNGGIVWASSHTIPETLTDWVAHLRNNLAQNAITFDNKPFRPHITLLRKAVVIETPLTPEIVWRLGKAQLYVSRPAADGSTYQMVSSTS